MGQQRLDVGAAAGVEVVDAEHLVAARQQAFAEVGADETGAAGDHDPLRTEFALSAHLGISPGLDCRLWR